MSSWWGLIARQLGVTGGHGSHKRRVAEFLGATNSPGSSWAQKLASKFGVRSNIGSYTSQMEGALVPYAASRNLYLQVLAGTSVLTPVSSLAIRDRTGALILDRAGNNILSRT